MRSGTGYTDQQQTGLMCTVSNAGVTFFFLMRIDFEICHFNVETPEDFFFFFFQSGKELKFNFRTKARSSLCAGRVLLCYTSFSCQRCNLSCALWVGVSPDWTVKPGVSRRPSPGSGIRSWPEDTECVVLTSHLCFFISAIKHVGISIWSYQTVFEKNFELLVHR